MMNLLFIIKDILFFSVNEEFCLKKSCTTIDIKMAISYNTMTKG